MCSVLEIYRDKKTEPEGGIKYGTGDFHSSKKIF